MKGWLLLTILVLTACQSKPLFPPSIAHENIRPELHLGEYAVKKDDSSIYTLSRGKGPETGLVELDIKTKKIRVLDSSAAEARDLIRNEDSLFYRVEDRVYELPIGARSNGKPVLKIAGISKLLGAYPQIGTQDEMLLLRMQTQEDVLSCRLGSQEKLFPVNGKIVSSFGLASGEILTLVELRDALSLQRMDCKLGATHSYLIEENAQASAARFYFSKDRLWLAFLHEEKGSLQLLELDPLDFKILSKESAGGMDFESYMGMDIAFFEDGDKPGLLFLDAHNLKLMISRSIEGAYRAQPVQITGAVGFYNCVLSNRAGKLRLTTHAFRSIIGNEHNFEDLLFVELDLVKPAKNR